MSCTSGDQRHIPYTQIGSHFDSSGPLGRNLFQQLFIGITSFQTMIVDSILNDHYKVAWQINQILQTFIIFNLKVITQSPYLQYKRSKMDVDYFVLTSKLDDALVS